MKKDFVVDQGNALVQGRRIFDLHNEYEFNRLEIGGDQSFILLFNPDPEWGKKNSKVALEFLGVDFLELSRGFGVKAAVDVHEIGYLDPELRVEDWLKTESQCKKTDHLVFRIGEGYIRVHSRLAQLVAGS